MGYWLSQPIWTICLLGSSTQCSPIKGLCFKGLFDNVPPKVARSQAKHTGKVAFPPKLTAVYPWKNGGKTIFLLVCQRAFAVHFREASPWICQSNLGKATWTKPLMTSFFGSKKKQHPGELTNFYPKTWRFGLFIQGVNQFWETLNKKNPKPHKAKGNLVPNHPNMKSRRLDVRGWTYRHLRSKIVQDWTSQSQNPFTTTNEYM